MDSATNSGTLSTHSCVFVCFIMLWPPARLRLWLQTWTPPGPHHPPADLTLRGALGPQAAGISENFWNDMKAFQRNTTPSCPPPSSLLSPHLPPRPGGGKRSEECAAWSDTVSSFRQLRLFGAFNSLEHLRHPSSRTRCDCAGHCLLLQELAEIVGTDRNTFSEMHRCFRRQRHLLPCRMTPPTCWRPHRVLWFRFKSRWCRCYQVTASIYWQQSPCGNKKQGSMMNVSKNNNKDIKADFH